MEATKELIAKERKKVKDWTSRRLYAQVWQNKGNKQKLVTISTKAYWIKPGDHVEVRLAI